MSDKIALIIEATDHASSVLGGIGQSLGNLGRIAGGLALGGVAAMGAGLIKLGSDGLTLNNSMEKVSAQLNAFTKDSAKTADIIEIVRQRAAKTPFEFDAMAKAAVALFPASKTAQGGLEGILEKAEILAASNPAEGLEGAAFALKEAVSGDFTSIIERFNLPRQYINDLKKEGVPNLEIVQRAMKEMGLDVDLVSNLANTAEGRWSTFKDTLANVAAQATKPIFDAMSGGLAQVNTYLEANGPLLTSVGTTIAGTFTTAIQTLSAVLPQIIAGFSGISEVVSSNNIAWQSLSAVIQSALLSATTIVNTWLPVVQSVFNGVALFLQTHSAQIQLLISTAWATITTIYQTAITTITEIINAFAPVVTAIFTQISEFLNANGADILATLTSVWQGISAIVTTAAEIVKAVVIPTFTAIASFINAHGTEIQAVLSAAWNVIKAVITSAVDIIKGVLNAGLAIIRGDWGAAWREIQGITQTSNNLIQTIINTAMDLIEGVIRLAVDNFKAGWEMGWQLMKTATDNAMTLIKDAINTGIETAKTVIANGVEAFIAKFNNLKDKMSVIGQQLLEGMVQGIRDKVGWLVDEAVRASNAVLAAIKNTLGIKSPSVEGYETSAYLIEGLTDGINDNAADWIGAGEDAANRLVERIRVTIAPLPDIMSAAVEPVVTQTISQFSGLADGVEDQLLTLSESFVELAQTGDTSSLHFAQSFEAIKRAFAELAPSFHDVGNNFDVLYQSMASGKFDVESYWKAWDKMLAEIKGNVSATMPVVEQPITTATQNIGAAFDNVLVVAGVAINTLTGEVLTSSNTMSSAMNGLANTVTGATQTMQIQAAAAAQAVAASMIAAGQVINTTQQQLAGFIQNGGVGGITGSTYTPSAAFQALFTNPPPAPIIAPPRPASVPKQETTNNNVVINLDVYGVDERTAKNQMSDGITDALRRSGLGGRYA